MPSFQVTKASIGASDPMRVGLKNFAGAGASLLLTITGSLTASVEVTGDDINKPITHWNDLDDMVGLTVSKNGNLAFPVTAVRLNVTAFSSGSATLSLVQSESP